MSDQPYPPPPPPAYFLPPPVPPAKPRGRRGLTIAIVVTVVVVLVIIVAVAANFHSGTLRTVVTSNHLTQSVSITLQIDGATQYSVLASPGQQLVNDYSETWAGQSCNSYTVTASSQGGGLGPETDSKTVALCGGAVVEVDLSV